jgi:hypothetical protein
MIMAAGNNAISDCDPAYIFRHHGDSQDQCRCRISLEYVSGAIVLDYSKATRKNSLMPHCAGGRHGSDALRR